MIVFLVLTPTEERPFNMQLRKKELVVALAEEEEVPDEEPAENPRQSKTGSDNAKKGDEGKNKSCLSKIFFSKCWSSKSKPESKKKGKCNPDSCPCGKNGPCSKIKKKPCPANKKQNGGKTNNIGSEKKTNQSHKRNSKGGAGKKTNICKKICPPCIAGRMKDRPPVASSQSGGGFCGMCKSKKHTHTACCCRCNDKSSQNDGKQESNKNSDADFKDAKAEMSLIKEEVDMDRIQLPIISVQTSKPNEQNIVNQGITHDMISLLTSDKPSTNFQLILPTFSDNDTNSDCGVTSHKIVKTLSTIHGPMKVDQHIIVKGTNKSSIIVTHGELCECNLCTALKHLKSTNTNSTDSNEKRNKNNIHVNHSHDCKCTLCALLETNFVSENKIPSVCKTITPTSLIASSLNKNLINTTEITASTSQISKVMEGGKVELSISNDDCEICRQGYFHKAQDENPVPMRGKQKKCHCVKCCQRRRIKQMNQRLKMEFSLQEMSKEVDDISKTFREIMKSNYDQRSRSESDNGTDEQLSLHDQPSERKDNFNYEQYENNIDKRRTSNPDAQILKQNVGEELMIDMEDSSTNTIKAISQPPAITESAQDVTFFIVKNDWKNSDTTTRIVSEEPSSIGREQSCCFPEMNVARPLRKTTNPQKGVNYKKKTHTYFAVNRARVACQRKMNQVNREKSNAKVSKWIKRKEDSFEYSYYLPDPGEFPNSYDHKNSR